MPQYRILSLGLVACIENGIVTPIINMKISAVIISKNEARNIGRCIDSLNGVVDEILVVDSFSTDDTPQICKEKGVNFLQIEWLGYASTKNKANTSAQHPYILSIDADEALSTELREEIVSIKPFLSGAYSFPRKNFFSGQWIKGCGWYPDRKIRLFPKDKAQWQGNVHETLVVSVSEKRLKHDLLHFTYEKIEEFDQKLAKYTSLATEEMRQKGKKSNFIKLYISPLYKFIQMYFLQLGILDGYLGWYIASRSAIATHEKYRGLSKK